ncbi:hypothetical protein, partial [Nitrosomonas sp.]|uniref:hypothetical protein n=1 Tax=Nitrosomonas sp. TaxID=42353 RepID=UPI0025D9D43D
MQFVTHDPDIPDALLQAHEEGRVVFFCALCDVQVDRFRHGRVLLASQLIAFFRVDRPWTEQHLLPLFGWS